MTEWKDWIGRSRTLADDIVRGPAQRLAATLGEASRSYEPQGALVPPLWHWLYFLEAAPRGELGPDGHAAKGGFLPPIDLPRRMYAGGRFTFPGGLAYGRPAEKCSTVISAASKEGRSGPLAFVTVRHEVTQDSERAVTEEHDIVYREAAKPGAAEPAPPRSERRVLAEERVEPDEAMLFRFSALTFNGHRIHYDHPYVTGVEGYPGLIVHGPLIAMLLFEAARRARQGEKPARFAFRARSPFFCGAALRLVAVESEGPDLAFEARTLEDALVMESETGFD